MSKLIDQLKKKKLTLIVELPQASLEMASAAESAGADAIIISEDQPGIIGKVKIPVGFDLSSREKIDEKEMRSYAKYDFINFHFEALSAVAKHTKPGKILALNDEYSLDKIVGIENMGAEAIDAAIVPLSQGTHELVVGDLQNYIAIAISSGLPVIIPTQREIKPSEVAIIADTGAKGLLLTKVVLGEDPKDFEKALAEYRMAVDDLG